MERSAGISIVRLERELLFDIRSPAKYSVCSVLGAFGGEMRFHVSLLRFLSLSLFLTCSGITARAQTNNGAISGSILDSSGGAVADAQVRATGVETHSVYTAVSSATGAYRFSDLVLGHYDITVTANGFKVSTLTGVEVQINSTSSLDITLQPGDVKETMTVVADAPRIQTETSEMGTV